MANRFSTPDEQFANDTGLPYAGGFLYFYASGTSTPLSTYSNAALTIPNTNPIELDSAGRAGDVFLQNLAYKVILKDINLDTIWTADPVYSSDYSTVAQFSTYPGNPNSHVAGTAGSGSIPSSVVWDRTNNVLYVATTTGNASTTIWTAVNPSTATATTGIVTPQGYLTPTSGTPIITADAISATAIYYAPFQGSLIPLYNSTSMINNIFGQLTLTLSAAHTLNGIFDVFVFLDTNGAVSIGTSPLWSTSTAGAGARAGLITQTVGGIWTNSASMQMTNGTPFFSGLNTLTINANQATYVGTIAIDAVAGQVTCHVSVGVGSPRKWGIYNAYNQQPLTIAMRSTTASWSGAGSSAWGASDVANNAAGAVIKLTPVIGTPATGLGQPIVEVTSSQAIGVALTIGVGQSGACIAVGVNSITVPSGKVGTVAWGGNGTSVLNPTGLELLAKYVGHVNIGINNFQAIEASSNAQGTTTLYGSSNALMTGTASQIFMAQWLG